MNSIESNNLNLKYQRFTSSDCNDIQGLENLSLWGKKNSNEFEKFACYDVRRNNGDLMCKFKAKIGARKT